MADPEVAAPPKSAMAVPQKSAMKHASSALPLPDAGEAQSPASPARRPAPFLAATRRSAPADAPAETGSGYFRASTAAADAAAAAAAAAEDLALRTARQSLLTRRDKALYFDEALALGTLVFTDTVPSVGNALFVVLVGNVVVYTPRALLCPSASLRVYVNGLIILAYVLIGVLALSALRKQVTTNIRWPFLFCSAWAVAVGAWTAVGIGSLSDGLAQGCDASAPFLFWFAAVQVLVAPLLAGAMTLKWFGRAIAGSVVSFCTSYRGGKKAAK